MDIVTENQFHSFSIEEGFDFEKDAATAFEHFANYCAVSNEYKDEFDIAEIHTGGGDDLGIDGIAIIVNGSIVDDVSEVDDLVNQNKFLKAEFIMCHAKKVEQF